MKRLTAFLLVSLSCSLSVSGANLLSNGAFNSDVSGWAKGFGGAQDYLTLTWNPADAMLSPASGSMSLVNTSPDATGAGPAVTQCVPVNGGQQYDLGAKMRIHGMQARRGVGLVGVHFYSSASCSGNRFTNASVSASGSAMPGDRFVAAAATGITAPASAVSALVYLQNVKDGTGGSLEIQFDDAFFAPSGSCVPDPYSLCLNGDRFRVRAEFRTASTSGRAHVSQLTRDSGYLWFFDEANIEAIVKVLNGCGVNSHHWVFTGGLTDVQTTIYVTDMTTGETASYVNPPSTPFAPVQDTAAFLTCP